MVESYGQDGKSKIIHSQLTYKYTQNQVDLLKKRLDKTSFPQREGFLQLLLKDERVDGMGMLVSIQDFIPGDEGIVSTFTYHHTLNSDYVLIVVEDHYVKDKSPLKGDKVCSKAKIVKIE